MQRLTDGLLRALSCRTGPRDPAVAAAWRTLSEAISRVDAATLNDASAEGDERDEAREAARAGLAAVPMPGEVEIEVDRRAHRRDTRPQSPRALRTAMLTGLRGSTTAGTDPNEAAKR
jgi:hypothetical protein